MGVGGYLGGFGEVLERYESRLGSVVGAVRLIVGEESQGDGCGGGRWGCMDLKDAGFDGWLMIDACMH